MTHEQEGALPILPGLPARLRLTGHVATGAQKTIYRAFDRDLEQEIAVICVERRAGQRADVARVQEMQALARVRAHPGVLELLDVLETESHLILCVPYLSRGNLAQRIAADGGAPVPIAEALRIAVQLADALAHVHRHGLIHGDIKAENVLVADDGSVRLADFGLAHLGIVPAAAQLSGTPTHLAPERIRGEQADARSDLYSFGCLLYELFAGRPPLTAGTASELLNLHLMARPRELQGRRRDVPLAVSQLVDRLLEKRPEARPQSARAVHGALSAALRTEAFLAIDADRSVALPSRAEAEAQLDRLARAAQRGEAGVALVTGELGAGKTELLRRFGRRAQASGFGISIGIAQAHGAVPYAPMIDALLGLAGELADLAPEQADRLLDFLYLHTRARTGASAGETGGTVATREGLFAAVLAALAAACRRRPILLLLADLDEADDATIELLVDLEYALSAPESRRDLDLLIVASCRTDALPKGLEALIGRAGSGSALTRIELERLEGRDVLRLVESHGRATPDRALLDEIATTAAGNALNAVELVHLLERRGAAADAEGRIVGPLSERLADSPLPLDSAGLVARTLEGRSPICRHALELAAILGIDFEASLVERLGRALDLDVGPGLDEAVALGILVDRGGRLGFGHPLFREALHRRVPRERRSWVHLKRVQLLQADETLSEERRDLEIAHHLIAAGDESRPQDLVEYAARAGEHALARFAWSDAARFFEAAIGTLAKEGPGARLAGLHFQCGIACFRLLDGSPCLRHFARAAALFSELGDETMRARVCIERARAVNWMGMLGSPDFEHSRVDLEECLARTGASHRLLRAEILAVLGEQSWASGDHARAEALCQDALEATRPDADHLLRAEISVILGLTQLSRLNQRAALATWRFGALHGRRANDFSATARCLQRVRMALFVSGQIEQARALTSEVAALNRIVQLPSEAALSHGITAAIAALGGAFEEADREIELGILKLARAHYPWALAVMRPTQAFAHAIAGDPRGALEAIEALVGSPMLRAEAEWLAAFADRHRALIDYFVGDPVRFPREARDALLSQLEAMGRDEVGLYQAALALEIAGALQDPELARAALPIVDEAVARGWVVMSGWPSFLPRLVGAARLLLGDVAGAIERLERALPLAPADVLPIECGRVRFDLARALVLTLGDAERDRARQLAREARDVLQRFPRNDFLERAEGLVRYLDERA